MDKETARLDAFTLALYQECWDNEDMLKEVVEFHDSSIINRSTDATSITLVPKRKVTLMDYLISNLLVW